MHITRLSVSVTVIVEILGLCFNGKQSASDCCDGNRVRLTGQKGGYDGYSECHYHSTNHVTAIRPVLHVFLIS